MTRTLLVCFFALYGLVAQAGHTVVTVVQPAAVAGIAFTGAASGSTSSQQNLVVSMPSGSGGRLIIKVTNNNGTGSFTGPAGWTELDDRAVAGQCASAVYWKDADGSEGASQTVVASSFSAWSAVCVRVTGANASQWDATPTVASGANNPQTSPAITTATNGAVVLLLGGFAPPDAPSVPSGFTRIVSSDYDTQADAVYKVMPTAGTQAAVNYTVGYYTGWITNAIAIKP